MGLICLECYKKGNFNKEYLNEYGLFDMSLVSVCTTICEICGKKGDSIDNFYNKEELQDLFTESHYEVSEKVTHLEDFTSYYKKALEGKNIGIYAVEIPEEERDSEYYEVETEVKKIEKIIQDQLKDNETIKYIYFTLSIGQFKYKVQIRDSKIYFKTETEELTFEITPSERERFEEALIDRDMTPKYTLNLFLAIGQFESSLLKKLEIEGINCEDLYRNTLIFIEAIEYGAGECELIYNFTEDDSFTLRNFNDRPFKLIEWCKQFL